jgi:hypothetical protein
MTIRQIIRRCGGYALGVFSAYAFAAAILCSVDAFLVCKTISAHINAGLWRDAVCALTVCFYIGAVFCYSVFCGVLDIASALVGWLEKIFLAALLSMLGSLAHVAVSEAVLSAVLPAAEKLRVSGLLLLRLEWRLAFMRFCAHVLLGFILLAGLVAARLF